MDTKRREKRRNILTAYGTAVLALTLLIVAAFQGPEIAFAVQDGIRCSQVISASSEKLDIASFNTGYETDLYRRLTRFAEGLARGDQYYVTVQDMELTSSIMVLGNFEKIAQSSGLEMLVHYLRMMGKNTAYDNTQVTCWKQCVIYGDDFAGGVNFILWYLELDSGVKLLADGETGQIYGARVNFSTSSWEIEEGMPRDDEVAGVMKEAYLWMQRKVFTYSERWNTAAILGNEFGGLDITERLFWLEGNEYSIEIEETEAGMGAMRVITDRDPKSNVSVWPDTAIETDAGQAVEEEAGLEEQGYQLAEMEDFFARLRWREDEEDKCINFCYPFGKGELNLRFQLDSGLVSTDRDVTFYIDMIFGFPEIYELIPEFMGN